jgi:2-hydroxy-6-oxonona-2,4-dienedioate hydrolase
MPMGHYWVELIDCDVRQLRGRYRTRAIIGGDGPALVLLHGTGGHAENYIRNIPFFSRHFRTIAIDLLWHGGSQTDGFDARMIPCFVDQIVDVMSILGLSRIHLEGQSLGGWVAMQFALTHPRLLEKLVLTTPVGYAPDPAPGSTAVPQSTAKNREQSLAILADPSVANIRKRLERIVHDPSIITDEAVAVRHAFYNNPDVNRVQRELAENYYCGGEELAAQYAVTDRMAAGIAAPTLVYWGDKNHTPSAVGRQLAAQIPGARFHSSAGTGHWAQFENADEHNRTVLEFLLDTSRQSAHAA